MATFEARTDANFKKLFKVIEGNGQDGLIVKTDRNTQFRKTASKALWVLCGVAVGLVATVVRMAIAGAQKAILNTYIESRYGLDVTP